jgi:hypothetical protein
VNPSGEPLRHTGSRQRARRVSVGPKGVELNAQTALELEIYGFSERFGPGRGFPSGTGCSTLPRIFRCAPPPPPFEERFSVLDKNTRDAALACRLPPEKLPLLIAPTADICQAGDADDTTSGFIVDPDTRALLATPQTKLAVAVINNSSSHPLSCSIPLRLG